MYRRYHCHYCHYRLWDGSPEITILPPANEVWGKVIFSQVSLSVHMGSMYDVTSCLAARSHVPSGGSLSLIPCSFWGVFVHGGLCHRHPPPEADPPPYSEEWAVHILLE